MNKVLFVSDGRLKGDAGDALASKMHYRMLKQYLKENLYAVFLRENNNSRQEQLYCIKNNQSKIKKILCILNGHPVSLTHKARKTIMQIIETHNINIVFLGNSISGKFAQTIKKKYNIKIITFYIDIEAILMKEQLEKSSLFRKMSLLCCIQNEKKSARFSDCNVVLHNRDKMLFQDVYHKSPDFELPIVTPKMSGAASSATHEPGDKLNILFVGVNYYPNINGVLWFIDHVIPLCKCNISLTIVGKDMEKVTDIKSNNIVTLIGTVENVADYYKDCHVVIAPIFEGGGMKVKIAEALSYGKTIIGTSESFIGYKEHFPQSFWDEKMFIADDSQKFKQAIDTLFQKEFKKMNPEIINFHKKFFSEDANLNKIQKILESVSQ